MMMMTTKKNFCQELGCNATSAEVFSWAPEEAARYQKELRRVEGHRLARDDSSLMDELDKSQARARGRR